MIQLANEHLSMDKDHGLLPVFGRLLEAVVTIGTAEADLAGRRRAFLTVLARQVDADAGFWAWGRGRPDRCGVAPVALIDFGFTDTQRAAVIAWGLEPATDRYFRQRIFARMNGSQRSTDIRPDVYSDQEWDEWPTCRQFRACGWRGFLHSVRYSSTDSWSNLFLLRGAGAPDFTRREARIADWAMTHVAWLHSQAEESLPPETFVGLTSRQRTVMLMLLDGLSRKQIASDLGITEDTVGDHIKSIYRHFQVSSSTELAALFLRGR